MRDKDCAPCCHREKDRARIVMRNGVAHFWLWHAHLESGSRVGLPCRLFKPTHYCLTDLFSRPISSDIMPKRKGRLKAMTDELMLRQLSRKPLSFTLVATVRYLYV